MRYPRTKDDYWFNKVTNNEVEKVYRRCPYCNMKVGIPTYRATKFCYMCNSKIYVDEELNELARRKYNFIKEIKKRGVNVNDKRTNTRKKI